LRREASVMKRWLANASMIMCMGLNLHSACANRRGMSPPALSQTITSLQLWNRVVLQAMQKTSRDLSTRQCAILLAVYLSEKSHSVKSLAEALNISKPAICRALDVLCREGFLKRKRDDKDRRQMTLQRTIKGSVYLSEMAEIIQQETLQVKAA
jgi:DNA-binding MarR family transcriptional regulator